MADDEGRIRLRCLEAEGYEVFEAADGLEALDIILRAAPDLLILDLAMPNLDGLRTIEHLSGLHGRPKPWCRDLRGFQPHPPAAHSTISRTIASPVIPLTALTRRAGKNVRTRLFLQLIRNAAAGVGDGKMRSAWRCGHAARS